MLEEVLGSFLPPFEKLRKGQGAMAEYTSIAVSASLIFLGTVLTPANKNHRPSASSLNLLEFPSRKRPVCLSPD